MRPLWRNALWLAFAAACGVLGYQQGLGQGGAIIANISSSNDAYGAFATAYLKAHPKAPNPEYDAYVARGLAICESVKREAE